MANNVRSVEDTTHLRWAFMQVQEASARRLYCKFHLMMEDGVIVRVVTEESKMPPKTK